MPFFRQSIGGYLVRVCVGKVGFCLLTYSAVSISEVLCKK